MLLDIRYHFAAIIPILGQKPNFSISQFVLFDNHDYLSYAIWREIKLISILTPTFVLAENKRICFIRNLTTHGSHYPLNFITKKLMTQISGKVNILLIFTNNYLFTSNEQSGNRSNWQLDLFSYCESRLNVCSRKLPK